MVGWLGGWVVGWLGGWVVGWLGGRPPPLGLGSGLAAVCINHPKPQPPPQ